MLVDQGPPEARVGTQLRGLGLRRLSAVVLTHPQRDHIGGAEDVLRRVADGERVPSGPGRLEPVPGGRARASEPLEACPSTVARAGASWRLGRLRLRALWPNRPGLASEDPNRLPVVLLATYGEVDVLLTADAETDVTAPLLSRRIEVLKVAHHGSEDPGLEAELRELRPTVAVISCGRGNDYGHPRPETLAALGAVPGLRLYRTDLHGRVVLETDGRRIVVDTQRRP